MMHSDVKTSSTGAGIINILLAVFVFLIFLFVPLVHTVVNGRVVESFTVAENINKDSGGFYVFLIFLMSAVMLVIGILKITLSQVFRHFVVSVVDFYYSLGLFIGIFFMVVAFGSQSGGTSNWGYEMKQEIGMGPVLLLVCSLAYFVTALSHFCSFYKWYPLQTLFWGLQPVLNLLVTSLLSLVAALLIPDSAGDTVLKTVGVIINWGLFFVEIWLVVTYRKEWNSKLRARMAHNLANTETGLSTPAVLEAQPRSPQEQAAIDKAVERIEGRTDKELKDILASPNDYSKSFVAAADIVLRKRQGEMLQEAETSTGETSHTEISDTASPVVKVSVPEPSVDEVPKVSAPAANVANDRPQAVVPADKGAGEVPVPSKSHKKYYIIGGASVAVVLLVLFFCLKGGETAEVVNVPAISEALYKGKIGKVKVQMHLMHEGDSLYGTYFYERNKQDIQLTGKVDGGRYIINEFVNGKNTGTFDMEYDKYNGEMALNGTWGNGKKKLKVFLEEKAHRIIPSADPEHPFVGEWCAERSDSGWEFATLGLYNKDTYTGYGFLHIKVSGNYDSFSIDSVLQLKGNEAVVQASKGYGNAVYKFVLTYNPADRSLGIKMEDGSSVWIPLDDRSLEQQIADFEARNQVIEEPEYDSPTVVYEEDVPPPPPTPTIEDVASAFDEEQEKEAERARLQAELSAELARETAEEVINKIYDKAEVMPEYPGGQAALMRYLSQNVKYPKVSQESGTQGKVVLQFVVNTDGSITDIHVITSVDPYLDAEALRVIRAMPRWEPGKVDGKPARVKYTVPIKFRLS